MSFIETAKAWLVEARRPRVSPANRVIAAHILMFTDAVQNNGVVSTKGAQVAREITSGQVTDPNQAAVEFFSTSRF